MITPEGGPRRLTCTGCLHRDTWNSSVLCAKGRGGPEDPFFHLPLWLQASCCGGKTLWALNEVHLDLLETYVGAKPRERGPIPGRMSLVERLPAWIMAAKHRDEILRTVGRLRTLLPVE